MDTVNKDLRQKIDRIDRIEKEKKKSEDAAVLKSEREFFRQEALRLNELCKELTETNENLSKENKIISNDLKVITKKWKLSENTNRQLLAELERNVKQIRNFEDEKKNRKSVFNNSKNILQYQTKDNSIPNINHSLHTSLENPKSNREKVGEYNSILMRSEIFDNVKNNKSKMHINSSDYFIQNNESSNEKNNKIKNNIGKNLNNSLYTSENINLNNSNSYNFNNYSTEDMEYCNNNDISICNNNINNINKNILMTNINMKDKEKLIKFIEQLKAELKREKGRSQQVIGEFNKILIDKKKIEKIFMDCVEEARREILIRKIREPALNPKCQSVGGLGKKSVPEVSLNEIKYENFHASDKKKLIESFLMKEEIINFIKENLVNLNVDNKNHPYFRRSIFSESFIKSTHSKKSSAVSLSDISKTNLKSYSLNLPYSLTKTKFI